MKKSYLFLCLLLGFHLLILSRLQFTAWPEMISFPYLINHGFVTYRDMVHAYPPLLVNLLAVCYKLFGYNLWVLKMFGWISILFSDLFFFKIIRKITKNQNKALFGVFGYIVLQSILEGNMVWPDLFIVPFLLLNFLFLLNKKYFWSGVVIGLALLTKQTGIFFLGVSFLWIMVYDRKVKLIFNFLFGFLITVLPFLFVIIKQSAFNDFINWTIIYPSKYWTKFPGYVQLSPTLRENLILLVLFIPLTVLVFKAKKKLFTDNKFLLLFGFLMCGIVGVYPRFSFFHFQAGLAFLVILYFYLIKNKYLLLIPVFFILILQHNQIRLVGNRFWNQGDLELAQTLKTDSKKDEPIYLLGLPSNYYVFSDRLPNTPWLDGFGWYMEIPGVQEEIIDGLAKNLPSTIFWETPIEGNWYDIGVYQPKMITDWIQKNYMRKSEIQKGLWEWTRK